MISLGLISGQVYTTKRYKLGERILRQVKKKSEKSTRFIWIKNKQGFPGLIDPRRRKNRKPCSESEEKLVNLCVGIHLRRQTAEVRRRQTRHTLG